MLIVRYHKEKLYELYARVGLNNYMNESYWIKCNGYWIE